MGEQQRRRHESACAAVLLPFNQTLLFNCQPGIIEFISRGVFGCLFAMSRWSYPQAWIKPFVLIRNLGAF